MKIFKNRFTLLLLAVFFVGISMVSCSQDNDSSDTATASILGRWALDKRSYTANGVNSPEMDYENNQPGCDDNDYFEFKENAVFENGYYDPNCAVSPNAGNWSKDGNWITITHPSEDGIIFELLSLSATEMKVRADLTGTEGVEPGMQLFIKYTLVKVN